MYNRFGTEATDEVRKNSSDDIGLDNVEQHMAELIAAFSRASSSVQQSEAQAEKEKGQPAEENSADEKAAAPDSREFRFNELLNKGVQPENFESKQDELHRLQDDLRKMKSEREVLSTRLGEIEQKTIKSDEDLKNILAEKQEIEEKNRELQLANEEALNRIKALTQEKERAVLAESEAREKYLRQLKENDDLADEINNLRSINERLNAEMSREYEAARYAGTETTEACDNNPDKQVEFDEASASNDFEERFGKELVTDSGMELFMMLRGIVENSTRDNNGVRMVKSWEEELEETIPGAYPDDQPITRKVRTKSEVSVEYIAGQRIPV